MWKKLSNMKIKEFDKFLKFAKQKEEPERFKVILKGGIDIFENRKNIAMIYLIISSTKNFRRGDVILNTDISGRKGNLSVREKLEITEKIWNKLIEEYKENGRR